MRTNTIGLFCFQSPLMVLAFLAMSLFTNAQDIHFSQFNESPLTLNPALCGAFNGQMAATINYRDQWPSIGGLSNGYNTMAASLEWQNIFKKWKNAYLSPGLSFFSDKSGMANIQATNIDLTVASGVALTRTSCLSAGLQAGWAQHSISLQGIQWGDQVIGAQYDPNIPSGEPTNGNSFSYMDYSAGMYYHYRAGQVSMVASNAFQLNLGLAVFHINEPNMSYYAESGQGTRLYMRYVFHGDAMFDIKNTNLSVVPAFMLFEQGPSSEIDLGAKLRFKLRDESKYTGANLGSSFDVGAYYRWDDAIIALVGLERGSYAVYMSFDVNTSSLSNATSGIGAFELSVRFLNLNAPGSNRPLF